MHAFFNKIKIIQILLYLIAVSCFHNVRPSSKQNREINRKEPCPITYEAMTSEPQNTRS